MGAWDRGRGGGVGRVIRRRYQSSKRASRSLLQHRPEPTRHNCTENGGGGTSGCISGGVVAELHNAAGGARACVRARACRCGYTAVQKKG